MTFAPIDPSRNPAAATGMFEAIMGGARPRVGTPPFGAPFPQTGGATAPTTPQTLPVKKGLSGFIERLLNPSNSLGQFGQALLASQGGPLGNAIGYMLQQRAALGQRDAKFEEWKRQFDYERANPKPSQAQPYRFKNNEGDLFELGDNGQASLLYDDPTPKIDWQSVDNGDGTKTLVPIIRGQTPGMAQPKQRPALGTVIDDPRKGGGASNGTGGFPVSADLGAFKRAIINQESGGRYGVANAEGSGAMGIGQVMPETARVLAGRLGMPWNPRMMASTSPAGRRYQDAITEAAIKEAWAAGNGDLATAAMYYHGGSDRKKWGPKTKRYAREVLGRLGAR